MSDLRFSKDVTPNAMARARQVLSTDRAGLDRLNQEAAIDVQIAGAVQGLRAQIGRGPVGTGVQSIIDRFERERTCDAATVRQMRLILDLFVLMHGLSGPIQRILEGAASDDRRGELIAYFDRAIQSRYTDRPAVDPGLVPYYRRNPPEFAASLREGWSGVCTKWNEITLQDRPKLVRDIFDSPKGYPKTARHVEEWVPPSAMDLTRLVRDWLDGGVNDSVFTGVSISLEEKGDEVFSRTPREQILKSYARRSQQPKCYRYFWFQLISRVNEVGAFRWNKDQIRATLTQRLAGLQEGFRPAVPAEDVANLVTERFDEVYEAGHNPIADDAAVVHPPERRLTANQLTMVFNVGQDVFVKAFRKQLTPGDTLYVTRLEPSANYKLTTVDSSTASAVFVFTKV